MKKTSKYINKIGLNVKSIRLKLNISQEKLAEMADLHRNYIGALERFEKNPTIETLETISAALKVDLIDLFI